MFKSTTTFVIGAGASAEVGLPVGTTLAAEIGKLVDFEVDYRDVKRGDRNIHSALVNITSDDPVWRSNTFYDSGKALSNAMAIAPSIDNFLHTHKDDREIQVLGKLAIVSAINHAEANSKMTASYNKPFDLWGLANTWYVSLAQHLFTEIPANDPALAFKNVSFIVFNYDRCLELFLIRAIMAYFRLNEREAIEILGKVDIVHPYGFLGPLAGENSFPYGSDRVNLATLYPRIRTFTESMDDDETAAKMKSLIREAETLIFLGFGFHEQNMDLLGEDVPKVQKVSAVRRVYATTFGMSASDEKVVADQIAQLLRGRPQKTRDDYSIETFNGSCAKLFAEYWRSLSASGVTQSALSSFDAL